MTSFRLTKRAKDDLHTIASYTKLQWGVHQRNRYIENLDTAFHQLARNPELGQRCDDIIEGFRKFPIGHHRIYYRNSSLQSILIVRILHKRMDLNANLR
jgi:toxin ParE1/3/4